MNDFIVAGVGGTYSAIAGAWVADTLVAGDLIAFECGGTSDGVRVAPGVPPTSDTVRFAMGKPGNGAYLSAIIDRTNLSYNLYNYTAAVNHIVVHGAEVAGADDLVFPTIAAGQVYGYTITDETQPVEKLSRTKTITYTATTGDTSATICTKLVALLNAGQSICTVTITAGGGGDDGIVFTGATAGQYFSVVPAFDMKTLVTGNLVEAANVAGTAGIVDGEYYDAATTITLATAYHTPLTVATMGRVAEGTAAQLTAYETLASTEKGNINALRMISQLWTKPTMLTAGQNYNVYVLNWTNPNSTSDISKQSNQEQTLIIAIPTGSAALLADMVNVMASL